ncbi:MAG: elongation factor P--(R)-beta-lysine ligase [Legionellaceae bacterium]|nr:elongation factor P--(R)-beta-lysine ligase [Legionellaceae bacterium]
MPESSWRPSTSIANLKHRAKIISLIRRYFTNKGYLEVETPVMASCGVTDVYLKNIKANFREKEYYLQTSPEYYMKRLLAAGSGPIFQLARCFRDDELGRWHNPEFTLLEFYQLDIDHHALICEIDLFLQAIVASKPLVKMTYQQAFISACDIDPITAEIDDFKKCLDRFNLSNVLSLDEQDRDQYLFLLMSHIVEPKLSELDTPFAIYDFPKSQASLAKTHDGLAARFEIYYKGIELANGFAELTDYNIQRERFEKDNEARISNGDCEAKIDEYLLQALKHGLPECSGVAIGVDRLLAIALNEESISKTMSFDFSRS